MKKSISTRIKVLSLSLAMLMLFGGCGQNNAAEKSIEETSVPVPSSSPEESAAPTETASAEASTEQENTEDESTAAEHPQIEITMENGNVIRAELYPETAPATVENFLKLVNEEFYDGLIFHRVIPGFMIQGGDPEGTGTGGPGWNIVGEFDNNGHPNPVKHERGVLSMARSGQPDSAGSQFFIMVAEAPYLDGDYAAFGKVLDETSMEAVDKIVNAQRDGNDKPLEDQRIDTVRVVG